MFHNVLYIYNINNETMKTMKEITALFYTVMKPINSGS